MSKIRFGSYLPQLVVTRDTDLRLQNVLGVVGLLPK